MLKSLLLALAAASVVPSLAAEEAAPAPAAAAAPALDEEGLVYAFTLSALSVRASSPLSYTPLELGYRFASGVQVRTGLDIFYYEAEDISRDTATKGQLRTYRFEMMDWRTSLCYLVPLTRRLRPLAGLSVDFLRGDRSEVGKVNAPKEDAYGFVGASVVLGLEWRFAGSAALGVSGRETLSFNDSIGNLNAVNLSWLYLF